MSIIRNGDIYDEDAKALVPIVPLPATQPLFPEAVGATDVRVTYVQEPGGPPDPRVTEDVQAILREVNKPLLYVTFRGVDGRMRVTLMGLDVLRKRGLPTDYRTLSEMFPAMQWVAR